MSAPLCAECAVRLRVSSLTINEGYDKEAVVDDIAVLFLDEPVPSEYDLPNVTLDDGTWSTPGSTLIVAGWGALEDGDDAPYVRSFVRSFAHSFIRLFDTFSFASGAHSSSSVHFCFGSVSVLHQLISQVPGYCANGRGGRDRHQRWFNILHDGAR